MCSDPWGGGLQEEGIERVGCSGTKRSGGLEGRVWALGSRKGGGGAELSPEADLLAEDKGVYCPTGRLLLLGGEQCSSPLPNFSFW